ncbi:hypothetical protein ACFQO7_13435, partial [Catellatospora aurea]
MNTATGPDRTDTVSGPGRTVSTWRSAVAVRLRDLTGPVLASGARRRLARATARPPRDGSGTSAGAGLGRQAVHAGWNGGRAGMTLSRRPAWAVATAAGVGSWLLLDSPVGGLIAAGYTLLALRMWREQRSAGRDAGQRRRALDLLSASAAELRAGGAGTVLLLPDDELDRAVHAAQRLAASTGAPLADLLERLEAQCRAADRADDAAHAQAAGAQLTAVLLAALPIGGIGLGHL